MLELSKKEAADYVKQWQRVNERQTAELRQTPFTVRLVQTAALMRFANSLGQRTRHKEEETVRRHWKRLSRAAS